MPASPASNKEPGRRIVSYLTSQFQRPRGPVGRIAGRIMASRGSNVDRNLWLVDLLNLEPHHRVLEIGPGPGVAIAAVGAVVTEGQIVAVDHSTTMLRQSRSRNRELMRSGRLNLRAGSAEQLPPGVDGFDRIYCMNVWQFWADPSPVIASLAERLRPGGRLAIGYQPRHPGAVDTGTAEGQLRAELTAAGLTTVSTHQLDIDPPVIVMIGS